MTDKRIAILCTSKGFGGLEMNTLKLGAWLAEYGWTVSMMMREGSIMEQRSAAYAYEKRSLQKGRKKRQLKTWIKEFGPGILLTPYNKDIAAVANYKRWHRHAVKLVYQQHMQVGISKKDIIHTLRYSPIDLWISPLNYLKEETIAHTRVKPEKIVVIPFGLEPEHILGQMRNKEEARRQLELPAGVPLMGVLGRIDPKKGQDFMIRAVRALKTQYDEEHHLLIMGSVTPEEGDAYLNSLYALVQQLQLQDQVHFRPYSSDVAIFFSAIDVFAMPSHGETFGMVTLEAMLAGRPVIGTDKDGTSEILKHGTLGYLHEKENIEDFCHKFMALQQNEDIGLMLEAARGEVEERYTKERMCEALDRTLSRLLL